MWMKRIGLRLWIAGTGLALAATASPARGQWETEGLAMPGPNERVSALVMHDDGSGQALYAGGQFDAIDGQPRRRIARYKDGQWSDVGGGVNAGNVINALLPHKGELIAAGSFSSIGTITTSNIAAWNGTTWQAFGPGLSNSVNCLLEFNGELIAGAGNQPSAVMRWTGSSWQPMGAITQGVRAMIVYNGELIVAGNITGGSLNLNNIARWTGTTWESLGGGTNYDISALAEYQGNLIAAGTFDMAGGAPMLHIAQWNGSTWEPLGEGLANRPASMAVHEGRLVVDGPTSSSPGQPGAKSLAQWDGREWTVIPGTLGYEVGLTVSAMLSTMEQNGPCLWVGGRFSIAGGTCVNNLAKHDLKGWSRLSECPDCHGLSGPMSALATYDDGRGEALYVAGLSRCAGTTPINRIVRWDGQSWSTIGQNAATDSWIMDLEVYDDGGGPKLYASGFFNWIDGVQASGIARWDGRTWAAVGEGVTGGAALTMKVFDDGTGPALYVGGAFTMAGGLPIQRLARWNGEAWSAVGGDVTGNSMVTDMIIWNDGQGEGLLIGGRFNYVAGVHVRGLAYWRNGQWGPGPGVGDWQDYSYVRTLAAWPPPNGSSLVVGGYFPSPGQFFQDGLALWDGTIWKKIAPGHTTSTSSIGAYVVHGIHVDSCDLLAVFGMWTTPHSMWYDWMQFWNGSGWRVMGGGVADAMKAFWTVQPIFSYNVALADFAEFQGRLYYAGDFTSADGKPAGNFARFDVHAWLACRADADRSGSVNTDDLLAVITQWGPCAACSADSTPCGGDGMVNTDDLIAVITQWGPCP